MRRDKSNSQSACIMNDEGPTRRRFQFSLRKLLLWTTVVALYLGSMKTLEFNSGLVAFITFWVAVVGGVRWSLGVKAAAIASFVIGTLLGLDFSLAAPALGGAPPSFFALLTISIGWVFGGFILGLVELTMRAVNWADKIIEGKEFDDRKG